MSLVFTVPHGGLLEPEGWPDRRHGCVRPDTGECYYDHADADCAPDGEECRCVFLPDRNTREMARFAADAVLAALGTRPHVVINNVRRWLLHRVYLPPNQYLYR